LKEDAKTKDKRKKRKSRNLEECKQNLEQAKISGNKFQIKIWTDIIKKLESQDASNKD
jgi:hypothetical protein